MTRKFYDGQATNSAGGKVEPAAETEKGYKKAWEDLNAALDGLWNAPGISKIKTDYIISRICQAQQSAYKALSSKPSPPSIQQEAIPETKEDVEKLWGEVIAKVSYHEGEFIPWTQTALDLSNLYAISRKGKRPSPPSVKTEREDDKWKFHCWKEFGGGERCDKLCGTCSGEDLVQPSLIVQEGKFQDSRFDSEKFWELHKRTFTGVNGGEYIDKEDFCIAVSCLETNSGTIATDWHKEMHRADSLQSQLYNSQHEIVGWKDLYDKLRIMYNNATEERFALKKERDDYRKALEFVRIHGRIAIGSDIEYTTVGKVAAEILAQYPIPQTPANG